MSCFVFASVAFFALAGFSACAAGATPYTPDPADPARGILVDTADAAATADSFARITGSTAEADRFAAFNDRLAPVAHLLFPSMTEPLERGSALRERLGDDALWRDLVERPLGGMLRAALHTDIPAASP